MSKNRIKCAQFPKKHQVQCQGKLVSKKSFGHQIAQWHTVAVMFLIVITIFMNFIWPSNCVRIFAKALILMCDDILTTFRSMN